MCKLSIAYSTEPQILTEDQIEHFLQNGLLVVENVLNPFQLNEARVGLARTLLKYGVDINNLSNSASKIIDLSSTNGAGGVLDIYYPKWKMKISLNKRLFDITTELWRAAFISNGECVDDLSKDDYFKFHPYGKFDYRKGYIYIDRIGYRLSTLMAEELGSLLGLKTFNNKFSIEKHNEVEKEKKNPMKRTSKKLMLLQRCLSVSYYFDAFLLIIYLTRFFWCINIYLQCFHIQYFSQNSPILIVAQIPSTLYSIKTVKRSVSGGRYNVLYLLLKILPQTPADSKLHQDFIKTLWIGSDIVFLIIIQKFKQIRVNHQL